MKRSSAEKREEDTENGIAVKEQKSGHDIADWFVRLAVVCPMLTVWNITVGGIALSSIILFVLTVIWMAVNIMRINRGQMHVRQKYARLDIVMILLLFYEVVQLVVTLFRTAEDEVPDYGLNLLLIGLVMLYLLMMETKGFYRLYLDLILYAGLVVMAVLLMGYLYDPQIGAWLVLWGDQGAAASYLLLVAVVSVLQYSVCKYKEQSYFYILCAFVSFFLLACNHSVISFWILGISILLIPVLLRPTALLWKRAMQMLFLFLFIVSNMSLLANYTSLLLVETSYDLEHSVYLDLLLAVGGVVFFHYWDRIPQNVRPDRIVLRRLYRLDKLLVKACFFTLIIFMAGGAAWQSLDGGEMGVSALQGFALPFVEELGWSHSFFYYCVEKQGILGAALCMVVILCAMERTARFFGWDKPASGVLCVALTSIFMQLFVWQGVVSILPVEVIFLAGAVKREDKELRRDKKNRKKVLIDNVPE